MLKNLGLRKKMLLMLFPLVTGLFIFAVMDLTERVSTMRSMRTTRTLAHLAVASSSLIHELQKERGLSSGFVASKGAKFGPELVKQREEADSRVRALKELIDRERSNFGAGVGQAVDEAQAKMETLASLRRSASALATPAGEVVAGYSSTIASLIKVISQVTIGSTHSAVTADGRAYLAFVSAKEETGKERATLNAAFAADSFDADTYQRFISILSAVDVYLRQFATFANSGMQEKLAAIAGEESSRKVEQLQKAALEKGVGVSLGVDPAEWFGAMTERINSMKQLEDALADGLTRTATVVEEDARHQMIARSAFAGILLILALTFGFLVFHSIMKPMNDLLAMLKDIAEGEGDLTKRLDDSRRDEIGMVCTLFNTFIGKIHATISRMAENTAQIAEAAARFSVTAKQMAAGADEVACQAGTVATASEEMAATSNDIAQNCLMAAESSGEANTAAIAGADVVKTTVVKMNVIAERVKESSCTVGTLVSRSQQIGEIVGTIEDIADQTNLLALNAAIEAARAGEQGRGFAVVADEVRSLAERTSKATKVISEMILAIQTETNGAVASMNEGVKEVEAGTVEAAKSGQALQEILNAITSVSMQVSQIATAAEEQTATTNEISTNLHLINNIIMQTASGAQESASGAAQLSRLADELQQVVGQFKLVN